MNAKFNLGDLVYVNPCGTSRFHYGKGRYDWLADDLRSRVVAGGLEDQQAVLIRKFVEQGRVCRIVEKDEWNGETHYLLKFKNVKLRFPCWVTEECLKPANETK